MVSASNGRGYPESQRGCYEAQRDHVASPRSLGEPRSSDSQPCSLPAPQVALYPSVLQAPQAQSTVKETLSQEPCSGVHDDLFMPGWDAERALQRAQASTPGSSWQLTQTGAASHSSAREQKAGTSSFRRGTSLGKEQSKPRGCSAPTQPQGGLILRAVTN